MNTPVPTATAAAGVDKLTSQFPMSSKAESSLVTSLGAEEA